MIILIFILTLALLVLVHEFGHFLAAKKNGVRVEEFGFGLPPRIFGIKKGETLYSINLLPFGGFVKLYGEEYHEIKSKSLSNRAFINKKPWVKSLIVIGGVIGNFLLGWILISYLFTQGVPVPTNKIIIDKINVNSPAAKVNLKPGDQILKIITGLSQNQSEPIKHQVKKGEYLWMIASHYLNSGYKAYDIARFNNIKNPSLIFEFQIIKIPQVKNQKNYSLSKKEFILKNSEEMIEITKKYSGQEITLEIERNGQKNEVSVNPRKNPPKGEGPIGVVVTSYVEKKFPWYQAPFYGLIEASRISYKIAVEIIKVLIQLVTFQKPQVEVAGPVGIVRYAETAIKFGKNAYLELIALLSFNLAIINILPFPALDGGRLMFILYEGVTKKKPNKNIEKYVNLIGMLILLSLALIITINDIIKIYK
ncbi:RIP metalloprotease RseP [Candidatus Roizmanbacteria bacterium CG03_land_8_20_14_0_80_35_26]|uniref:Zinc metalloprotease n=3 Tax=Candidatus Roizmaniibacteriota TaxID=1752723 RepID=A0A2M7BW82_9BACT|nr:MAG: RIP metalloprotease RseP [Candidatus Roizmanbacteria bacterium CG11_big_fil_rev_8_21_14_0_20_35_14]PIV10824.1 MAG: RIP metalloprotease RseP [Candidatus Roizmanbacteria bacterium CG03_land_8_20_14_0_80_35_26]PJC32657.1 MAG: RIP metalloprotease RseP [Candidatus Roizmanbacteria bacterium CG_4_9_14_0_2_um_filter_36_12]PJC80721.1 MAG: RIP metalloprotease RseP [Candidatus Roizmanbacteria bacterium CG_4_8_14_3_um_filter_36_12]